MLKLYMQKLINKYFKKLCSEKFLICDDEVIIGKSKDVIENLKSEIKYVNNSENNIDKENAEFITNEAKGLIKIIQKDYPNKNDVIKLKVHPMTDFYVLQTRKDLYDELKEYYEEMEENYNGN